MLAQKRKQKHWSRKGNGDAFPSMLFHNQFQVTFYINGTQSWLSAKVQRCQPVWSSCVFTLQRQKKWRKGCGLCKTEEFVPAVSRPWLHLNLSPSWQRINKKKWLAREAFKVRTQARSIHGAYCKIRGLCGHMKSSNLRGKIMCAEFIFDPQCELLEKCSSS